MVHATHIMFPTASARKRIAGEVVEAHSKCILDIGNGTWVKEKRGRKGCRIDPSKVSTEGRRTLF